MRLVLERATLGHALTETELPDELTLHPGEEETLELPSLAGAGYVWEASVDDEAVAEATTQFQPAGEKAVGQRTFSRHELLTLRGLSVGMTDVKLVQRRTWETGVEPVAAHILTVNVVADG